MSDEAYWVKTVGAPAAGDPRDGELHKVWGGLPDHFDLEPWEDVSGEAYVRYWKSGEPPEVNEAGEPVWIYEFRPIVD